MTQKQKVIVLAEAAWTEGHIETQMQLFLRILLNRNCRVIILCADPHKMVNWVASTMPLKRQEVFGAFFWNREKGRASEIKGLAIWNSLSKTIVKAEEDSGWKADTVFLSLADFYMNGLNRSLGAKPRFDYPWVGLYFWPKQCRESRVSLSRILHWINQTIFLQIENCRGLGILDEGAATYMTKRLRGRKLWIFPDVTDERLPAVQPDVIKSIIKKANGRSIIGLVGLLEERKGLINLIQAIQMMDQTKYYFLLAGNFQLNTFSPDEQKLWHAFINAHQENCHIELNYIDDPVIFNSYCEVCDTIFLAYRKFLHSSGILTKAAVFAKPVIVSRGYCMAERANRFGLGLTVTEGDVQEIIQAIVTLTEESSRATFMSKSKFKEYSIFHSKKTMDRVLSEMLNLDENDVG